MFPAPADVLRSREGSLSETPFPLLLHALYLEERTCVLEVKQRQLEKRVFFEDGAPVGCVTNLLHETLGKYLVEKGKLSEQDYQSSLSESVQTGVRHGELLVKKGLISPYDLYKQLQANLAHKILDLFRWSDAHYRLLVDTPPSETPVKMNAAQLVLTGSSNFLPFETVAGQLTFVDEQRFALTPKPVHDVTALKLSPKDTRFLQVMRSRPTFAELGQKTQTETEPLMRRLFAFAVLGLIGYSDDIAANAVLAAESAPEPAVAAPVAVAAVPVPAAPAPPPAGVPFSDEDEPLRNALTSFVLESRSKDPFALLDVPEDVTPVALKKAFLGLADRYSPVRFRSADLKDKAETLLVTCARAYAELSNAEQAALWRKRRAASREKERAPQTRPSAAEQFQIRTQLLDASAQFAEGRRRLQQQNWRGALEYFEYACDIEPKALHLAYRGWSRFKLDPTRFAKLSVQDLDEACRQDPGCHEAHYFNGEVRRAAGDLAGAEECFRRAFKAAPQERRYAELIQQVMKQRK